MPMALKIVPKEEDSLPERILLDVMSINDGQPVLVFETEDN